MRTGVFVLTIRTSVRYPPLWMCEGEVGRQRAAGDGRVALGAVAAEGDGHAALDAVGTALERFSRRPRGDRPGEVIRAEMMAWRRLIDRMELEFSGMVTELAGCDEDEWEGCPSPTAWIKQACRTTGTAAWNALVVGEQAARMPASARALRDGQIGYAHLALMARTAAWIGGLPAVAGVPAPRFDEGALLARARVGSVAELRRDCAHLRHAADPRRFLTEQVEEVEARFLELKATEGGALFLRGYLDTEGGATLRTALEPLARPAGVGDGRSRERRFADALVELAGHALDSGALPQHAGQRPHLQVTASLATLRGEPGAPAAELELGGPIAAETARRLGCDTGVTRVVFGAELGGPRRGPGDPGAGDRDPPGGPGPRSGLRLARLPPSGVLGRAPPSPPLGPGGLDRSCQPRHDLPDPSLEGA